MIAEIKYKNKKYSVNLSKPIDISIPVRGDKNTVNAWYISKPAIIPEQKDDWIAKVSEGASVNFNSIQFNPHSHGTHTECIGHITPEFRSIHQTLQHYFFTALLISITPDKMGDDRIITKNHLQKVLRGKPEALIIRTLPNDTTKPTKKYSHTNWPYLTEDAAIFIRESRIEHLLIDLPSVDREKDNGKLKAHKAFWNYPIAIRNQATITELIYVPDTIKDGNYILNLQVAAFENDAAPSKPVLYQIQADL